MGLTEFVVPKLYRGVCCTLDQANEGQLRPKGSRSEVVMQRNDCGMKRDGKFNRTLSENNAVRAHHLESGMHGGCFVSFTKSRVKAEQFATTDSDGEKTSGFVYEVDEDLFLLHGVVAHELPDPEHPGEMEVTLRAADNDVIPNAIVISKYSVSPDE